MSSAESGCPKWNWGLRSEHRTPSLEGREKPRTRSKKGRSLREHPTRALATAASWKPSDRARPIKPVLVEHTRVARASSSAARRPKHIERARSRDHDDLARQTGIWRESVSRAGPRRRTVARAAWLGLPRARAVRMRSTLGSIVVQVTGSLSVGVSQGSGVRYLGPFQNLIASFDTQEIVARPHERRLFLHLQSRATWTQIGPRASVFPTVPSKSNRPARATPRRTRARRANPASLSSYRNRPAVKVRRW
jgi:hypothetical protein